MSKNDKLIMLSAGFFKDAIAVEGADLAALFAQALGYMQEMEVKVVNLDNITAELTNSQAKLLTLQNQFDAEVENGVNLAALLATANSTIEDLSEDDSLTEQIETLLGKLSILEHERDEALAEVVALSSKLDLQEKVQGLDGILVTAGGESKMLIGKKFRMRDTDGTAIELTHDELAQRQDLLDIMHAKGSGSLVDPEELTNGLTEA